MRWKINFYPDFEYEFDGFSQVVQDELLAHALLREEFGSSLGRPHVDTLNNSSYPNMKELRFKADGGVWRVAFAFDPAREAILLVAGSKGGISEKFFYKQLIKKADNRYTKHLELLETHNDNITQ